MARPFYVRQLERNYFKRLSEGWAYTLPGVCSSDEKLTYVVNDAEKTKLLQRLDRLHVAWTVCIPLLLLLTGVLVWENYGGIDAVGRTIGMHSWIMVFIIFCVLAWLLVGFAIPAVRWLVVRPVLRHRVPSRVASGSTRQRFWERQLVKARDEARKSSLRWLVLKCLGWACICWGWITWLREAATGGHISFVGPLLGLLICAAIAAEHGAALYLKLKGDRLQD